MTQYYVLILFFYGLSPATSEPLLTSRFALPWLLRQAFTRESRVTSTANVVASASVSYEIDFDSAPILSMKLTFTPLFEVLDLGTTGPVNINLTT